MTSKIGPGRPGPLGPSSDAIGVNFALFSRHAERVELCLFDDNGDREIERLRLPARTDDIWHGYVPGLKANQLYGFRVYGPYDPRSGHRFNHHKLLLDPCARMLKGELRWNEALFGYCYGGDTQDLSFDMRDSAPFVPKSQVVDQRFDWDTTQPLQRPWHDTVIYELNVRSYTIRHPGVPESWRGTFAGLSSPAVLKYLVELGITAVELMPIHGFIDEWALVQAGLRNLWGYNPIALCAPEQRYLSQPDPAEFKAMVRAFHEAGLEVILDVVFNHTAEADELGPTICFRGIDNASYYRLRRDDPRFYEDFTGCRNTLNIAEPGVLDFVLASLRHWVVDMRVDGFRFDLAPTLGRAENGAFDPNGSFFQAMGRDPALSRVKLIAEPWDLGPHGYRLGNFPPGWLEWNDRYRDAVRRFWRGDSKMQREFAERVGGSSDIFDQGGGGSLSSINYVTAHDGFTLADLVSYERKHNEPNGQQNRDGTNANFSWNCGIQGPTESEAIRKLRAQHRRNMLATLLLSQGVPMILAGDEFGRSQQGNNNAYCQDNLTGWVDWSLADRPDGEAFIALFRSLVALRRRHKPVNEPTWIGTDGYEMTLEDWQATNALHLALLIKCQPSEGAARALFAVVNAGSEAVEYTLPNLPSAFRWFCQVDTANLLAEEDSRLVGCTLLVHPHSLRALRAAGSQP